MTVRNKNGTFAKGKSGNTKGRTAGSGVTGRLRKAILDKSPELLQMLVDKALEEQGTTAALALLNKVLPNIKPGHESVCFELDVKSSLAATGEQVIQRIADGSVPLDSGAAILTSLASLGKLHEIDDLSKRIEKLENAEN